MTIADTDRVIKNMIDIWHVYGAETICNALARACIDHWQLKDKEYLLTLLENAINRVQKGDDEV